MEAVDALFKDRPGLIEAWTDKNPPTHLLPQKGARDDVSLQTFDEACFLAVGSSLPTHHIAQRSTESSDQRFTAVGAHLHHNRDDCTIPELCHHALVDVAVCGMAEGRTNRKRNDPMTLQNEKIILQEKMTQRLDVWSPKEGIWTGEGLGDLFAPGEGAIHVVDDFEGGAIVIRSFEDYIATWSPVMSAFSYWSVQLVEDPEILVSGDLATVTFEFVAEARDKNGDIVSPNPGQHGTHIWLHDGASWRLVHEHLTNAQLGND